MTPKEILQEWIDCFNAADAVALANLYAQDAINHQVANTPVIGKTAIHKMFVNEFATSKMVCIVEHIFEDGEWAIMEWKDPLGLRGCGFFHVQNDKIVFQRGYWDKLSFLKQHGLTVENSDKSKHITPSDMGIIIHSLESVSFKDLYAAFSSAFKDYDFSLNADELRRMLDRRGYNPQLSFGAFFEGRLISFVFNGTGMYNNILTAYDTGTGTVPSFRGLHLTQKIFTFSLELIYQQGVRQYVLEVLQHNHKAIKIYRKLGFETQRNFNYYSAKLSDIVPVLQVNHTACRILPSDLKNCLNQTAWFDFHPSWQNDRASLERGIDNLDILGAYEREELVGFVIFEPASGDISSLAVAKDYRRKGIGKSLLKSAVSHFQSDVLKFTNVDCDCESVTGFLSSLGLTPKGQQFEMVRKI